MRVYTGLNNKIQQRACVWNSKFHRQTDGDDSSNYVFQLHIDLKAFNSPLIYSVHAAIERDTCGGKHCRHCSAVGNWVCTADIKTNFLEVSWRETIIVSWNGLVRILLSSENHKRHRSEMRSWPDDSDTYNVIMYVLLFALFHRYLAINDYYLQCNVKDICWHHESCLYEHNT